MRTIVRATALTLALTLAAQSNVFAQQPPGPNIAQNAPIAGLDAQTSDSLSTAMANGDVVTVNAIVAANQANPTVLAAIASALLAFAQANPQSTNGALMAAIAVNTGALTGADAILALNIVASNPTALALLTNPNAPNTGGSGFAANNQNSSQTTINNSQNGSTN